MKRTSSDYDVSETLSPELECRKAVFGLFNGGPKKRSQALTRMFPGPVVSFAQFVQTLEPVFPRCVFSEMNKAELFVKILTTTLTNWDSAQLIPVGQFADRWMRREYSRNTTKRWREPGQPKKAKLDPWLPVDLQDQLAIVAREQNPTRTPAFGPIGSEGETLPVFEGGPDLSAFQLPSPRPELLDSMNWSPLRLGHIKTPTPPQITESDINFAPPSWFVRHFSPPGRFKSPPQDKPELFFGLNEFDSLPI